MINKFSIAALCMLGFGTYAEAREVIICYLVNQTNGIQIEAVIEGSDLNGHGLSRMSVVDNSPLKSINVDFYYVTNSSLEMPLPGGITLAGKKGANAAVLNIEKISRFGKTQTYAGQLTLISEVLISTHRITCNSTVD